MTITANESLGLKALLDKVHLPGSRNALKILIYGMAGVGKTTFASTAPNPLFIDVERGTTSLVGKNIPVIDYKSFNQVDYIADMARKGELEMYDTLVFDSISEMQSRILESHLMTTGNPYAPQWQDYSFTQNQIRSFLFKLTEIPQNVIVTSSVKEEKDSETERINLRLDLPPKLSSCVISTFDVIGYLDLNQQVIPNPNDSTKKEVITQRRLILRSPNAKIICKSRIGGDVLIDPIFSDLTDLKESKNNVSS